MKEQTVQEKNALLQEKLTTENEKYYGNFLIYMRTKGMVKEEEPLEMMLLVILQDILDAQENGTNAETYFGKNPKQIADELLKDLPSSSKEWMKSIGIIMGTFFVFSFLPWMMLPDRFIDLGKFLIVAVATIPAVFFILWFVGQSVYHYQSRGLKLFLYGLIVSIFVVLTLLFVLLKTPLGVYLTPKEGIGAIVIVSSLLLIVFLKEKQKGLWVPFLPVLVVSSIGGVIVRLPQFASYFATNQGKLAIAILLSCALVLQYVLLIFLEKKKKTK